MCVPLHAGTYGSKLGVASSLREFLAELMEEKTGVCDSYCYVEIDGTRHFFPDQFVDKRNPVHTIQMQCNFSWFKLTLFLLLLAARKS